MTSNKEQRAKQFLISARRRIGASISTAPFWIQQKKGDRIWNKHQLRHWRSTKLGKMYRHKKLQEERGN